jgi:hypothetical protein
LTAVGQNKAPSRAITQTSYSHLPASISLLSSPLLVVVVVVPCDTHNTYPQQYSINSFSSHSFASNSKHMNNVGRPTVTVAVLDDILTTVQQEEWYTVRLKFSRIVCCCSALLLYQ